MLDERIKILSKDKQKRLKEILNKLDDFQLLLMRDWTLSEFSQARYKLLNEIVTALETS